MRFKATRDLGSIRDAQADTCTARAGRPGLGSSWEVTESSKALWVLLFVLWVLLEWGWCLSSSEEAIGPDCSLALTPTYASLSMLSLLAGDSKAWALLPCPSTLFISPDTLGSLSICTSAPTHLLCRPLLVITIGVVAFFDFPLSYTHSQPNLTCFHPPVDSTLEWDLLWKGCS